MVGRTALPGLSGQEMVSSPSRQDMMGLLPCVELPLVFTKNNVTDVVLPLNQILLCERGVLHDKALSGRW